MSELLENAIELATEKNIDEILNIYHSLIGKDGCTWDFNYPSIDEVKSDIDKKSLFIVLDNKEIIAVAAAGKDEELISMDCYSKDINAPCFLARIGVKTEFQNNGIAKYLISFIEKQMITNGFDGMHFLVSKTNPHALAVYDKMGYVCCGECEMYDKDWYCYEKKYLHDLTQ